MCTYSRASLLAFAFVALTACQSTNSNTPKSATSSNIPKSATSSNTPKSAPSSNPPKSATSSNSNAPKPEPVVKFKDVNFSEDKSFSDAMNSMVSQFGVTPQVIESEYGKALWFEYDSSIVDKEAFQKAISDGYRTIYDGFYTQLKSTCNGQFGKYGILSVAMFENLFDPSLYDISKENLNLLLDTYSDRIRRYYRDDNFDRKKIRADLKFRTASPSYDSIYGYGRKLLMKAGAGNINLSQRFTCSQDGKIKEAIAIGLGKDASKHYAIFIGEETLTNFINEQLDNAIIYAKNVRVPEGARISAQEAREAKYNDYVTYRENIWASRSTASYELGDKVCSFDNKMGYIEQLGTRNQKILWKGRAVDKSQGYFFGNVTQARYKQTSFRFKNLNDVTWESKQNIASCSFDL